MNCNEVLSWLERHGSQKAVEGMARYGIESELRVFGVPMGTLLKLSKQLGKDHDLAQDLWQSGCYEARLLAALVDDPARVTSRQMDAWAASFENWADCDTVCFKLFDQSPIAWKKLRPWASSSKEFVRRASFALMACLALHDKDTDDDRFLSLLPLIEKGARDERNFVKKAVSWALRSIGERSPDLHLAALAVAGRLAESTSVSCRWIAKDVAGQLKSKAVQARLARRSTKR
jgi:3-methyladenine DNA glycosylase AlkD